MNHSPTIVVLHVEVFVKVFPKVFPRVVVATHAARSSRDRPKHLEKQHKKRLLVLLADGLYN